MTLAQDRAGPPLRGDGPGAGGAPQQVEELRDQVGHLVTWTPGNLDTWSPGYLDIRSPDHLSRFVFTWLMIGGFGLIIYWGPLALMITVFCVQVKVGAITW